MITGVLQNSLPWMVRGTHINSHGIRLCTEHARCFGNSWTWRRNRARMRNKHIHLSSTNACRKIGGCAVLHHEQMTYVYGRNVIRTPWKGICFHSDLCSDVTNQQNRKTNCSLGVPGSVRRKTCVKKTFGTGGRVIIQTNSNLTSK